MKWVMHSRDGGRFVCQLLAASLQQVGHRAGSGLRAAIVDREAYQLHSFWGHKTNSNQLFRRRSTTPNYITRVVFLLRVYIKKTTYNLPNHTLPLIRLEVPAMRFTWLLDCLCRAYGAFPTQNAVKAQLSILWDSQDLEWYLPKYSPRALWNVSRYSTAKPVW